MASKKGRRPDHRTRVGRERSARTLSRILEAALRVFADMGPDAPKIDDFVAAAGVSRGTFYNHFESVEALLTATSEWTTRELLETIEAATGDLEGPAVRFGIGLRLFFAKAKADPVWSRFVARVWKLGGVELPTRDLEESLRARAFTAPSKEAARDLLFGAAREALARIGREPVHASFGDEMTAICLHAVGLDPKQVKLVLARRLPEFPERAAE